MKRIPTFVAGMLTAAVIGALGVGALAASGAVTFNASNLQLNGQQISAKGENYTLANGQQVPASITYTDETGGGTTYLPVRRISELLGVETGWDNATGSVTVGKIAPATNTTFPTDYSDWSAEEEEAYQVFEGMWTEEGKKSATAGKMTTQILRDYFSNTPNADKFAIRYAYNYFDSSKDVFWYGFSGKDGKTAGYAACVAWDEAFGVQFRIIQH